MFLNDQHFSVTIGPYGQPIDGIILACLESLFIGNSNLKTLFVTEKGHNLSLERDRKILKLTFGVILTF